MNPIHTRCLLRKKLLSLPQNQLSISGKLYFHCYNGTFFPCDNTDWHSTCHLHTAATILDSPLCLLDNQQADERSPYCEDSLVGSLTAAQGGKMTRSCPWRIEVWMTASASHALFTQTRHARSNFKALRMPWASTVGLLIGMWRNIGGGGEADWVRGERGGHESQVPQCQERSKHTCWLHTGIDKTLRESQQNKTGDFYAGVLWAVFHNWAKQLTKSL